jgi:hypothetical protein
MGEQCNSFYIYYITVYFNKKSVVNAYSLIGFYKVGGMFQHIYAVLGMTPGQEIDATSSQPIKQYLCRVLLDHQFTAGVNSSG